MENAVEEQAAVNDDDVVMTEQEVEITAVNPPPLAVPEKEAAPVPEAEAARQEIINIPSQPAPAVGVAGPSCLNCWDSE